MTTPKQMRKYLPRSYLILIKEVSMWIFNIMFYMPIVVFIFVFVFIVRVAAIGNKNVRTIIKNEENNHEERANVSARENVQQARYICEYCGAEMTGEIKKCPSCGASRKTK